MTQGQAIVLSTFEAEVIISALEILNPDATEEGDKVSETRYELIDTLHRYIKESPL